MFVCLFNCLFVLVDCVFVFSLFSFFLTCKSENLPILFGRREKINFELNTHPGRRFHLGHSHQMVSVLCGGSPKVSSNQFCPVYLFAGEPPQWPCGEGLYCQYKRCGVQVPLCQQLQIDIF